MKRRLQRAVAAATFELITYAESQAPHEACGLLGWSGKHLRFYRCENAAESPTDSFLIGIRDHRDALLEMEVRNEEFWGVFHSHPKGAASLSERDLSFRRQLAGGLHWVIVGLGERPPVLRVHEP